MVCLLIVGITPPPPPPRCDLVALVLRHQNVLFFKLQSGTDDTCSRAGGLLGTLGWSDGGSFSLPQDDIDESADQRQREGHPRQDVGVAEGVGPRHPLRTHHRVDDGAAHHEQTCEEREHAEHLTMMAITRIIDQITFASLCPPGPRRAEPCGIPPHNTSQASRAY